MSSKIEHEYTDEIVCPYCGYEHCDSWETMAIRDDVKMKCHDCDKKFKAYVHRSEEYSTEKIEG